MLMIGIKHFILPLMDKRNLIAIFLVMLFFGIFRWSGGSISTNQASLHDRMRSSTNDNYQDDLTGRGLTPAEELQRIQAAARAQRKQNQPVKDDGFDQIFDGPAVKEQRGQNSDSSRESGNARLEDIEKSLGLR